jgi:hypothetical protein
MASNGNEEDFWLFGYGYDTQILSFKISRQLNFE